MRPYANFYDVFLLLHCEIVLGVTTSCHTRRSLVFVGTIEGGEFVFVLTLCMVDGQHGRFYESAKGLIYEYPQG